MFRKIYLTFNNLLYIFKYISIFFLFIVSYIFTSELDVLSNDKNLNNDILKIYKRSLMKWNINYDFLDLNKAGSACIPIEKFNKNFIEKGLFEALGYSWNIESKSFAIKVALEGCNSMKKSKKLANKCDCRHIIFNNTLEIGDKN